MSINPNDIQSIADGVLMIRALRNRHADGHEVATDATAVMTVINSLECRTAEDAIALMDITQTVAADMFVNAGGDVDDPHGGSVTASHLAVMVMNLGKAMQTIEALMVAHPVDLKGRAN